MEVSEGFGRFRKDSESFLESWIGLGWIGSGRVGLGRVEKTVDVMALLVDWIRFRRRPHPPPIMTIMLKIYGRMVAARMSEPESFSDCG